METRQVILQLRTAKGLSQEELAAKVYVTRQAVSRWETGVSMSATVACKSDRHTQKHILPQAYNSDKYRDCLPGTHTSVFRNHHCLVFR